MGMMPLTAQAWVVDSDGLGVSNDLFQVNYGTIDTSNVSQAQFNESVGNVLDYWSSVLNYGTLSSKITIDLSYEALDSTTLGQAGSAFASDLVGSLSGNPSGDQFQLTSYTPYETKGGLQFTAITEAQSKLLGYNKDTAAADIEISFNSTKDFYYGDAAGIGFNQFDFESVFLHEISHGMGIVSSLLTPLILSIDPDTNEIEYDLTQTVLNQAVLTDDRAITDPDGNLLYHMTAWDALLDIDLTDPASFQPGSDINLVFGSEVIGVFNPDPWDLGSSLSHPEIDGVLNYQLGNSRVYREFSEQDLAIFQAIGYEIAPEPTTGALILTLIPLAVARRRRRA